jgi:hypothetical protein
MKCFQALLPQNFMNSGMEELNDLYSSPNIILTINSRRMRWVGHVAHMRERGGVCMFLVGRPEGKRPLGKPRHSWEVILISSGSGMCGHGLDRCGSG